MTLIAFRIEIEHVVRRLLLGAAVIAVLLLAADYWLNYREFLSVGALQRFFNTAREDSLTGFIGVAQAVLMAATAWGGWALARAAARAVGPEAAGATVGAGSSRRLAAGWLVLACLFTYLAIDDGAMVHERMGTATEEWAGEGTALAGALAAFPSYAWQVVVGPVLGVAGLFMAAFFWRQLPRHRALLVVAMAFMVVAVGLDFIEGLEDDHPWNVYAIAADHYALDDYTLEVFYATGLQTLQHFSRSIEEILEILANTLLWSLLLLGAASLADEVKLLLPRD